MINTSLDDSKKIKAIIKNMKTKISNLGIFCGFYFSDTKTLDKTSQRTKLNCFIIDTASSEGLRDTNQHLQVTTPPSSPLSQIKYNFSFIYDFLFKKKVDRKT